MVQLTALASLLTLAAAVTALPNSKLFARQSDVNCLDNDGLFVPAGVVNEAVECVNFLASIPNQDCTAGLMTSYCRRGNTQISGMFTRALSGEDSAGTTTTSCGDVAQAAGRILDFCSQGSGSVKGQTLAFANTEMQVDIRSVPE